MNFHKTIGFLATLLLVLGLGVPDSFAQDPDAINTFTVNGVTDGTGAATIADNVGTTVLNLSVTVNFDAALDAGMTRTVMVGVKDTTATTTEVGDYSAIPSFPVPITVTGDGGTTASGTGTVVFTPVADADTDNETIVLEATIGEQAAVALVTIADSEVSATDITLSLNGTDGTADGTPAETFADNSGANTLAITVSVNFEAPGLPAGETRTVMVGLKADQGDAAAEAGDYTTIPSLPVSIAVTNTGATPATTLTGSRSIAVTPQEDDDYADEDVVLEATIENSDAKDEAVLRIDDTDVSVASGGVSITLNGAAGDLTATPAGAAVTVADNAGATAVEIEVTLTFAEALPTGQTRTVMVGVKDTTATTTEDGDYSTIPQLPVSITVTGDGDTEASGSISIALTPATDTDEDNENIILEATVEGSDEKDDVLLTIRDIDNSAISVTITLNGAAGDLTTTPDATAAVTVADIGATVVAVTVTATFQEELEEDETRTVMVAVKDTTATTTEDGDYTTTPPLPVSITVTAVDGALTTATGSMNIVVTPAGDTDEDNEDIILEATIGDVDDDILLTISDSGDPVVGPVTAVAFDPDMLSLTEGMAFTESAAVTVTVEAGLAADHEVTLSVAEDVNGDGNMDADDLTALGISSPVTVSVAATETGGSADITFNYTPPEDANSTGETITITATVGGQSGDLTLNIADNDMGAVTSVAFDPDMLSLTEGMAFTGSVDVIVGSAAGPPQTVMVALSSDTPLPLGTINSPIDVAIAQDATATTVSVSISYTPPEDDNSASETITITGMAGGQSGTLALNVADNDMGAVTSVEFSPDMLSLTEGTAVTTTVTVTVNTEMGAMADHEVVLTADGATLTDLGITSPVTVSVAPNATSGTADVAITYTPPPDTDLDDEMVTVTATGGGQSGTLTLNVADSTPSAGTIKVSTSLESIRENSRTRNVVVTASLDAAPGTGNTVTVTVDVTGGATPVQVQIPIADDATSGTATVAITPVNDEVFSTKSFTVMGISTGYRSGMAMIDIVDDDASDGALTVTSAPASATLNGGAQTLAVKVTVWLATPEIPIPNPLVVNVATDKGTFPNGQKTTTVSITNIRKHPDHDPATRRADGNKTVNLSLAAGDVNAAGNITVTASVDKYETGTREIPIRARGALDVAGYSAVISKPTGTTWGNIGNDKIFVDVTRHGNVAYPWVDFESINVSVRDTAHADFELEEVTASGFNRESNGAVTFVHPSSPSLGDVLWRGNDTIRFEIRIRAHSAYPDPVAADPTTTPPTPFSPGRAANGQYLGAYAHVEFVSGNETASIETKDDETSVYPADPSLVNNAKVGDGRLIRIDNLAPAHSGVAAISVTSGDEVDGNIDATVGDEIRVAVALSETNLFRESGLRIQLQIVDGVGIAPNMTTDIGGGARNNPSKNKDFSTSQVIAAAAADDSLIHTYKVTEGYFKVNLDDFVEGVGPKGTKIDLNEARAQVRAGVKDQAGNYNFDWRTGNDWIQFDVDSRSPGVSILYPSADPDSLYDHTHSMRFTGAVESIVEGVNVDDHLNPLAILVDEDLSALKVYAAGADTLDIFDQIPSNVVGDSTAVYDTSTLSSTKKDGEGDDDKYPGAFVPSSANRAGTEIELVVLATDVLGNTTKTTISGVTHDASPPVIEDWFPKNSLLPEDQINDATPPIFTLSEDVDSIAVTFEGSDGSEVVKQRGGVTTKGEDSIDFSGALTDEISYDMTIFVRDLAGNVFITPADSSANMRFNAQFDNPVANQFDITGRDSVIAGQANILTIQAQDYDSGSDTKRNALTYKNAVRISAWDASGGAAESVWFEGTGVTDDADNPDGVAMLSAADWRIGKRDVTVKSNKATGLIKILVQHVTSGQGDTAVLGFESGKEVYVGAADFAGFDITAWEEGAEGAVDEIWGNYTLRVVPVDRHGNPSVRAFKADPASAEDSLAVLDTRVKDNAFEYKDGIDVEIIGVPTIEDFALLVLSIEKEGANYDLVAPDNRRTQTVQVRVVTSNLMKDDTVTRGRNIRSSAKFNISAPLTPVLTVWVEGVEGDQAGNDVVVPATVTVAAEGYNAGDMVTFTQNGQVVGTLRANDEGVATAPPITVPVAGTAVVSATNGRYATGDLTITFVETPPEPARKSYVDANGDPVYLISDADMTVGVDDFLALVAAFMSSMGDDNYNAQADVDDNGTVEVADFLEFLTSWGRTAVGPATKPLVLLPGINENAEFSLSLGSERVVAGEMIAVDVSLANVAALMGYGFALNYETDKFEFVSVTPADEDLLKSTGGETLFHHIVSDGQITVANGLFNGTAVSGGGDAVRFVFRVLREFEDNARFEIADGLVFDPSQLSNPAVVAGVLELQSTPREFALHQNFPNPFNPDTTIKYDLAESADVTLQIYNVLGQVIRTLVASEAQNAGRYQIRWNGMDDRGVPVSSGIYFYQISADGKFSDVRKLMLLK